MADTQQTILTGLLAFAGGFLAGVLLAPDSGSKTRERITKEAQSQLRNLGKQLDGLENRIDGLQKQVKEGGTHLGERVVDAAKQVVSGAADEAADFTVEANDVAKDLRRMPRK